MTIDELQLGPICSALAPEDVEIAAANALADLTIGASQALDDAIAEADENKASAEEYEEQRDDLARAAKNFLAALDMTETEDLGAGPQPKIVNGLTVEGHRKSCRGVLEVAIKDAE